MEKFVRRLLNGWPILLSLLIFIIITVLFLWNEKIDLSSDNTINDGKLTNYFVALFTAIGAIGTIYLTYKQQKKSEEEKKIDVRPDLVPKPFSFLIIQNEGLPVPVNDSQLAEVEITNEGPGKAEKIETKWIFNSHYVQTIYRNVLELPEDDPLDWPHDIPFIHSKGKASIPVPPMYFALFSNFFEFEKNFFHDPPDGDFSIEAPALQFHIRYRDIIGNDYEKLFGVIVFKDATEKITAGFLDWKEILTK